MRCHICDALLKPEEIKLNPRTSKFEPCSKCLTISYTTFKEYNERFGYEEDEDLSDEAINKAFNTE